MRFHTAETLYTNRGARGRPPAELAPVIMGVAPITDQLSKETVPAIVNHGRWIVECPFCAGAQAASRTDPRFLCTDCGNITVDGRWVRVSWPRDPEAIEELLMGRPVANRNWRPGETAAQLREENEARGVV